MLEWTCHVCSDLRPDKFISVFSKKVTFGRVICTENIRYCNDRYKCIEAAPNLDLIKK